MDTVETVVKRQKRDLSLARQEPHIGVPVVRRVEKTTPHGTILGPHTNMFCHASAGNIVNSINKHKLCM